MQHSDRLRSSILCRSMHSVDLSNVNSYRDSPLSYASGRGPHQNLVFRLVQSLKSLYIMQ